MKWVDRQETRLKSTKYHTTDINPALKALFHANKADNSLNSKMKKIEREKINRRRSFHSLNLFLQLQIDSTSRSYSPDTPSRRYIYELKSVSPHIATFRPVSRQLIQQSRVGSVKAYFDQRFPRTPGLVVLESLRCS
jgi:hypothetical protein